MTELVAVSNRTDASCRGDVVFVHGPARVWKMLVLSSQGFQPLVATARRSNALNLFRTRHRSPLLTQQLLQDRTLL